ncbi:MAG: uroporphyrinogen decarboxylase family protein [Phycisphaerae bacterium]
MTKRVQNLHDLTISPFPQFDVLLDVLWRRRIPEYVPFYELFVNYPVMSMALGKEVKTTVDTVEFYCQAGYDYVPVWPNVPIKLGSLVDTSHDYPITNRESFEAFTWPTPEQITFPEFEKVGLILPEGMKIIGQTGGIFEMAEGLCGYAGLCYLLADDRGLVFDIFERIGQIYEVIYSGMARDPNVGAIVISDDLGYKTQTLISPSDIREFVFPWYRRLVRIIHDQNKPCILHSCGNLSAVMDELIDKVEIDAKHSYEDAILPVTEAKKKYGDRIAVLGGFDVDRLCRGTEEEVREYTRFLVYNLGRTGGYALGSGNSIAPYIPIENYLTLLDEGWKLRNESR